MSHETDPVRLLFASPPRIETDRLVLRPLEMSDASDIYEYAQIPQATQYLLWDTHRSLADSLEFVRRAIDWRKDATNGGWGITLRTTGKLIGTIGLHNYEPGHKCVEMGYVVGPAYWNQGYMTEAVRGVILKTFGSTDLNRIHAHCYLPNVASGRVMEKAGMRYEGILRERVFIKGQFRDIKMYGILRTDHA